MKLFRQISQKRLHTDHFTKGFLLSYLLVMVLPILSSILYYFFSFGMMRENVTHTVSARLLDSAAISEMQVLRYFSQIESLANDKDVVSLLQKTSLPRGSSEISDVFNAQVNRPLKSDLSVFEYYIYFKNIDVTLSSNTAFLDSHRYYGNFFKWAEYTYEEWYHFTMSQRHDKRIYSTEKVYNKISADSDKTGKMLMLLQSLPMNSYSRNAGYIALFIKEDEFMRLLKGIDAGPDGFVFILDGSNQLLASYSPSKDKRLLDMTSRSDLFPDNSGNYQITLQDREFSISYTKSKLLGWTYISAIPTSYQYGKLADLAFKLIVIDIGILFLCIALAVFLAKRNALPWRMFREAMDSTPEITASRAGLTRSVKEISDKILHAIENNKALTANQLVLLEMIQTNIISKVLAGSYPDREQMLSDCNMAGLNLASPCYCISMIHFKHTSKIVSGSEAEVLYRLVLDSFQSLNGINSVYLSASTIEGALTLLVLIDDSSHMHDTLALCFQKTLSLIREKYGVAACITVSSVYTDLFHTSNAVTEVRRSFSCVQNSMDPDETIWTDQMPHESTNLCYPIDFEKQLNDQVSIGNTAGVTLMFNNLYQENVEASTLDPLVTELLRDQLNATVVRLLSRYKYDTQRIKDNIEKLGGISLKDTIDCASLICTSLSNKVQNEAKGQILPLGERLMQFIHQNYSNHALCMDSLRTVFDYSCSYLNEIYTSYTGQSFSCYLEKVRLEKACELLSTDLSIMEISDSVGYSSSHSFRRAFKRCYGIQPVEYRKLILHT